MAKKGNTKYHVKPDKQLVSQILMAIAYIAIGVLFCVFKAQVLGWIIWVVGILLILKGAVDFLSYKLTVPAIVNIALGVLTIVFGYVFAQAIAIVVGIVIILYGLSNLLNNSRNIFTLAISILTIVGGFLLVFNPNGGIEWLFIVIGVVFIIDGVLALVRPK